MKTIKTKTIQVLVLAVMSLSASTNLSKSETLSLYDDMFTISGLPTGFNSSILSARWGVWNSGSSTFVQAVTSSVAAGYVDIATPELSVTLSQINNSIYTAGTQMALAIFATSAGDSQALNWGGSIPAYLGIFTDTSWVAPSFSNSPAFVNFTLTANTTALVGGYAFNAGNQTLTLIPEPSSMTLGALGLVSILALRRKNSFKLKGEKI